MRWTIDSTCVCTSATCSSVASGDTTYTSSYFLLIRLLLDYGHFPLGPATAGHYISGKVSINVVRFRVRVKDVHHFRYAIRSKHLRCVRRATDERFEIGLLAFLELREHVIGQIAPAVSAPD